MQTMDFAGRVIYMNTFSKTIAPALRISYMILPPRLLDAWEEKMGFYSCTVPAFEQLTLTRFLDGGYFERHLSRMRKHYRAQLAALRYGAPPIVARTGGLADTVIDANEAALSARVATGFQFTPINADGLRQALRRAFKAYAEPKVWARIQNQGMKSDVSWENSAARYADLYSSLLAKV